MSNSEIAEQLKRIASGSELAFREVLQFVAPKLRAWLAAKYGGTLQASERDAILATVAGQIWRSAATFDASIGDAGAWLIGITRNAARAYLRGEQKHREGRAPPDELDRAAWPGRGYEVDDTKSLDCRVRDLERAIESLPRLQRAIVEADLAAGDHADDARLAAVHSTSVSTIRVSRIKARKNLLKAMRAIGYDSIGNRVSNE